MSALNLSRRLYITDAGKLLPVTNLFDADGQECQDQTAVTAVAGEGDEWHSLVISDFTAASQ